MYACIDPLPIALNRGNELLTPWQFSSNRHAVLDVILIVESEEVHRDSGAAGWAWRNPDLPELFNEFTTAHVLD